MKGRIVFFPNYDLWQFTFSGMRSCSFVRAVSITSTYRGALISSNCLTLKTKAKLFSETSVCTVATTQCHILEDLKIRETILIARLMNLHLKWSNARRKTETHGDLILLFFGIIWREDVLLPSGTEALFLRTYFVGVGGPARARFLTAAALITFMVVTDGSPSRPANTAETGCFQSHAADKASLYDDRTVPRDCHDVTTRRIAWIIGHRDFINAANQALAVDRQQSTSNFLG